MKTVDRLVDTISRCGALAALVTLGLMPGASRAAATPLTPPVVSGGAQAAAATSAQGPRIEIAKHMFSRATVTVPVGTTVTWVNHDDDTHTVVSSTALFRSPGLDADETFSYRFTKPGTYQYFCTLHPLMVGKVIVR